MIENATATSGTTVASIPNLITLIIGGGITIGTTVLSKHIWNWLQRPKLRITDVKQTAKEEEDDLHISTYMVYVENDGRTAAENCKPRIVFEGWRDWDDADGGATVNVEAFSCWSETGKPSRITINKDEIVPLDIFRIYEDYRDGTFEPEEDRKVRFPSRDGWNSYTSIEFMHDSLEVARENEEIASGEIQDTVWTDAFVEVTSANAESTRKNIDLDRITSVTRVNFPTTADERGGLFQIGENEEEEDTDED